MSDNAMMSDEFILLVRDSLLPGQGESFDVVKFVHVLLERGGIQRVLETAGALADAAGMVTGESLNFRGNSGPPVMALVELLPKLKQAVATYNQACIDALERERAAL